MKLTVEKPFKWAHRGVEVKEYVAGDEIKGDDNDPDLLELAEVGRGQGWIAKDGPRRSLSTGLSTASSDVASLSTSASAGLSTATSNVASLSTSASAGLSTASSDVASLSTSASTGLSTATSSIAAGALEEKASARKSHGGAPENKAL